MRTNAQAAFWGAVALLLLATGVYTRAAISGDWYRSGNDMRFILKDLRTRSVGDYWTGPWAGQTMFRYYRPLTSTVFACEVRAFGEDAAKWQTVSWLLHLASVPLLAFVLFALLRSGLGAWVGAAIWALRDRILLTIEWVPAQTDLLAGFFALLCLALLVLFLQQGSRVALIGCAIAGVLSALSKETGFILAGLIPVCVLLCTQSPPAAWRAFAWSVLFALVLVLVRWFALSGAGFLPGQAVGDGVATRMTVGSTVTNWLRFLLPGPLGPNSPLGLAATWAFCVSLLAAYALRSRLVFSLGALIGGLAAVALLLGDGAWLLLPRTWTALLSATWCFAALLLALDTQRSRAGYVLLFGLAAALPLYHVVYNPAGNVTYLPGAYHALYWGWIAAAMAARLSTALKAWSPGTDAGS